MNGINKQTAAAKQISDTGFEAAETIEEVITKIEAIAYLVESIGINVKFTGVPSDENLIAYASDHLYRDLIDATYCLGDLVSRLREETAPEVTE
ncbi:MAG: hypothetical protein E7194_00025 [Erysipelotrichaceae bacterium]|nr:hypothetical protein [Erysipelotrichaceae bacterium]